MGSGVREDPAAFVLYGFKISNDGEEASES